MTTKQIIKPDFSRYGEIITPPPFLFPLPKQRIDDGLLWPEFDDPTGAGDKAIKWLEQFKWMEGRASGKNITRDSLAPFQRELIRVIFGHVDPVTGTRYFNRAFLTQARKNSKSTTTALCSILLLASSRKANSSTVVVAGSVRQASRVFDLVMSIASSSPEFFKTLRVRRHPLFEIETAHGNTLKVLPADPDRAMGLSCSAIIADEIAFWGKNGNRLMTALKTSQGSRKNPIIMAISTVADTPTSDPDDVFMNELSYAQRVASGEISDPRHFPMIYMTGDSEDISSPEVWKRANPGISYSLSLEEIAEAYQVAVASGSQAELDAFASLRLNRLPKQSIGSGVLSGEKVQAAMRPMTLDDLKDADSIAIGIDLGGSIDMAAITACAKFSGIDGDTYRAFSTAWISNSGYQKLRSRSNFDALRRSGSLTVIQGDAVPSSLVADEVIDWCSVLGCSNVAIDPAMAALCIQQLESAGITVHLAKQGSQSMTSPILLLQEIAEQGRLEIPDDQLLASSILNAEIVTTNVGMRVTKQGGDSVGGESPAKIDALICLLNTLQWHLADSASSQHAVEQADTVSPWLEPDRSFNIKRFGRDSTDTVMLFNESWASSYVSARYDELGSKILSSETRPEKISL